MIELFPTKCHISLGRGSNLEMAMSGAIHLKAFSLKIAKKIAVHFQNVLLEVQLSRLQAQRGKMDIPPPRKYLYLWLFKLRFSNHYHSAYPHWNFLVQTNWSLLPKKIQHSLYFLYRPKLAFKKPCTLLPFLPTNRQLSCNANNCSRNSQFASKRHWAQCTKAIKMMKTTSYANVLQMPMS